MDDIFKIIELAIAPVFLLTGISGLLNVMSGRLGRVVDRARVVEQSVSNLEENQQLVAERELKVLWRRVGLSNWSIGLCTFAGLLTCILVVGLFSASFFPFSISAAIKLLFVASLVFLIAALSTFLLEIRLATKTLRAGHESRIYPSH